MKGAIALALVLLSASPALAADEAARLYAEGLAHERGAKRQDGLAVACFMRAAKLDHPGAQRSLATHYVTGRGVTRSLPEALRWYGRAAAHGDGESFWKLGALHERRGAKAKAYACYRLAGEFGDATTRASARAAADRLGAALSTPLRRDADELATAWRLTIDR